ncbi:hypothetical protein AB1K32_08255 [Metabacillus dongyingensis]|uniref:hypothetical protein n=1 Tax=Metabacillus dongyingensis TaxID=2874282 RepID=UPI003B8BAB96
MKQSIGCFLIIESVLIGLFINITNRNKPQDMISGKPVTDFIFGISTPILVLLFGVMIVGVLLTVKKV